jgi:hypothetical protein
MEMATESNRAGWIAWLARMDYRAARPFRFRVLVYLHRAAGRKIQGRAKVAVLVSCHGLAHGLGHE